MSRGTWVKPAVRTYTPNRWVVVCLTPTVTPRAGASPGEWQTWGAGSARAVEMRRGRWRVTAETRSTDARSLLAWIHERSADRRSTWVLSPCASQAATLLGLWDEWDRIGAKWSGPGGVATGEVASCPARPGVGRELNPQARGTPPTQSQAADGVSVHQLIARGNPTIIKYSVAGRRLTWVSGSQYTSASESALARSLRIPPPGESDRDRDGYRPEDTSAWRCEVWASFITRWCDEWRGMDGGPWSATIGGLAYNYVRKRLAPKSVLSHAEHAARDLEERALFGGRASVWCLAPVGTAAPPPPTVGPAGTVRQYPPVAGPVELWDVAGMYPTILSREDFPTMYVATLETPSVKSLRTAATDYFVIADVTMHAVHPEYPVRRGERVTFPLGTVRTVLTGPELRRALDADEVTGCVRATLYRRGRPFAVAAAELLGLRAAAAATGDEVRESIIKSLSVSFAGKLAQRRHDWVRRPNVAPKVDWGEWSDLDVMTGAARRFRAACGLVWEREPHRHGGRPLAACFAALTAYGRELMRGVRESLPPRSVVSQDTDGAWVVGPARDGLTAVARSLARRGYTIRRKQESRSGRWIGPRHYWTDRGWVLSGFHRPDYAISSGRVRDTYSLIPQLGTCSGPPAGILTLDRDSGLTEIDPDGAVDADGWVTPRVCR